MDNEPAWEAEPEPVLLEACVCSREDARAAVAGGAKRLEVCARASLGVGGLTPPPTLVEAALEEASAAGDVEIVALVRPRPGDFCYDAEELADSVKDVVALRAAGCRGFVLGCLTAGGHVDEAATSALVDAANGVDGDAAVTFHRAVDEVLRAAPALKGIDALVGSLVRLGCSRILSSGGAATARGGRATLWALRRACGRHGLELIVAGGVTAANVPALLRDTGARAARGPSGMVWPWLCCVLREDQRSRVRGSRWGLGYVA
mmetsp:Transcript_13016/g.40121  ORF Transcript_13016/g.40121 Transcript_13016/m.40121 type:complete len:262 (-) Transcript_13016:8-793(-)